MSKYKGAIRFDSKMSFLVFKLARRLSLLSLFCGIVAGVLFVGRDSDRELVASEATPTLTFLAVWFVLRALVNMRIRASMVKEARREGLSLRRYRSKTRKAKARTTFYLSAEGRFPNTKRGQQKRQEHARHMFHYSVRQGLNQVESARLLEHNPEGSRRMLLLAQEKGQAIVDRESRAYAIREYAARNGIPTASLVNDMLRKEKGAGPVTKAVKELAESVHYKHNPEFENPELKGGLVQAILGGRFYYEYEAADGSKRRDYGNR